MTPKVGDTVKLKGLRSNSNARQAAQGVVIAEHNDGSWDVEAGVDRKGVVILRVARSSISAVVG